MTEYRKRRERGTQHLSGGWPGPFFCGANAAQRQGDSNPFESGLLCAEKRAWSRCREAIKALQRVRLSRRLRRRLEEIAIPSLSKLGLEEDFLWALFKMAAPSWERAGSVLGAEVSLHPSSFQQIQTMRSGVLLEAKRRSELSSLLSGLDTEGLMRLARMGSRPENLSSVLEEPALSWIILPRAYDHLERSHSRFLLIYVKCLSWETDPDFLKILTRILLEFLANFTVKHVEGAYSRGRISRGIFYGYTAMFWKSLRSPPTGFEDLELFEAFYRWAKRFHKRFGAAARGLAGEIRNMEIAKRAFFPTPNVFGLSSEEGLDPRRFLITLRHGDHGVETALRHFRTDHPLLRTATPGGLAFQGIPGALGSLLRLIQSRYARESERTQEAIRLFLSILRSMYDWDFVQRRFGPSVLTQQLKFPFVRTSRMIDHLSRALS